jgi:UDP-3-O-[3-hydroxymyristoyl] N-acetylglucosamine deacetylase
LIGDLALLGKQIIGRIVADRAGHAMHTALVSRLLKDHSLWEETTEVQQSDDHAETAAVAAQTAREI